LDEKQKLMDKKDSFCHLDANALIPRQKPQCCKQDISEKKANGNNKW